MRTENMATATVIYHYDDPGWWAESPEVPEYSAFGDSLDEVRMLAHEGLPFAVEDDALIVVDRLTELHTFTTSPRVERKLSFKGMVPYRRFHQLSTTGLPQAIDAGA